MNLAQWTNIAIVFLSIQAFILMLVPLVVFFFMVRGMNIAGGALPGYMKKAQSFSRTVRTRTVETSDQITKPLLKLRGQGAGIESAIRSFSSEVGTTIYGDESSLQARDLTDRSTSSNSSGNNQGQTN